MGGRPYPLLKKEKSITFVMDFLLERITWGGSWLAFPLSNFNVSLRENVAPKTVISVFPLCLPYLRFGAVRASEKPTPKKNLHPFLYL